MICCSAISQTKEKLFQDMAKAGSVADIIEVRLDYLDNVNDNLISKVISKSDKPLIMTCRRREEGGRFCGDEKERISILKKCIELGADYVDVELSAGKNEIKNIINTKRKTKIIVSYHNFKQVPANMAEIYNEIKSTGCDIIKVACMANSVSDNIKIFELIKKANKEKKKIIGMCMGELGENSRILNLFYGSYLTFGSLEDGKESAPGQISCEKLREIYRINKINDKTQIYGLIGNPVSKSLGFIGHNLLFKKMKINALYVNFLVDDLEEFVINYKNILSGFSVTMPYKEDIIKYLDGIDQSAEKVRAVNTVLIKNNKLFGYNTDAYGAVAAIEETINIKGKNIVIIGAGGVAKALAYGIIKKNGNLMITNRTEEKGKRLAKEMACNFSGMNEIKWNDVDILINATSVGMLPSNDEMPIESKNLKKLKGKIVFDSVYRPEMTKLLKEAEKNKCITIKGLRMFVLQAEKQFEIFTGRKPVEDFFEKAISRQIQ